jgi:hypothetical protein
VPPLTTRTKNYSSIRTTQTSVGTGFRDRWSIGWLAIWIDFDAPHVSGCGARERPPAGIDCIALRWRIFAEVRLRDACGFTDHRLEGFTALQLEVVSGIAIAPSRLFEAADLRDDDLAELRVGGIVSQRGQFTHGYGELVDLFLLVVALGCQQARLDKQRVDLVVDQSQRAFWREPLTGPNHTDGEHDEEKDPNEECAGALHGVPPSHRHDFGGTG